MFHAPFVRRLLVLGVLLAVPGAASGQLISLKTVPVAAGDQFLIFPSDRLAMGGVSIALDDDLLDPFVNPARGAGGGEPNLFSSPTFYSVSNDAGSARTLPVGAVFGSGTWFGGGFAALQNLKRGDRNFGPFPLSEGILPPNALGSRSATNRYGNLHAGRTVGDRVSLGFGASFADLGAMDGVEHLYALADAIDQQGDIVDLRVGLAATFEGDRRLEAVLLHNRFNMTHDVSYVEWVLADSANFTWERRNRIETNLDQTRTWGAHVGYHQPVGANGWRVGGVLTANRKLHPEIPNYEIMNIPRDPGHTNAWNVGVGIAKVTENTTFGLDLVYEPAGSDTWAEAEGPVATAGGDTIPDGGKTVENAFTFANTFINMGVAQRVGPAAFQLGVRVSAYDVHLDQWDNVAETFRRQDEDWMEWTPSWGARVRVGELELRYFGRVTTGTGRPGVAFTGAAEARFADAAAANDVLLAPSGPLTLQEATVMTHQVTVAIPIR